VKKEDKNLVNAYKSHLLASGKKTKGFRHSFNILTEYLDGSDFLSLDYREAQNFQSWMTEQEDRYSHASILSIIGPLSAFWDYLKKRRLVLVNPFRLIERIKAPVKLPGNIPDEKEMDELMAYLGEFARGRNLCDYKRNYKAHLLCELLYSTGMRISEAAAIRMEDIDLTGGTVLVHDIKTNSERIAYLNDYVRDILIVYLEEFRERVLWRSEGSNLLFGASTNLKKWLNGVLEEICIEMGREKVTSHIFRHAFGYHMLKAGCDIRKIQKFLGHRRLSTTGVYTKVDTEALRNILDQYHPRGGFRK